MFVDVVGCSQISNNLDLKQYNEFLGEFRQCFDKVCTRYKELEYEPHERDFFIAEGRGDEGCLKLFVPSGNRDDAIAREINTAVKIALDLKRQWMFAEYNRNRIHRQNLLPAELAIGIHVGKVWVNQEDTSASMTYRPEGYAINLSKRIESEARTGKFTHILLSEGDRGQLHNLTDESTYTFDNPFPIFPKGISREIRVFEIKHHFLATDWTDWVEESSIIYSELSDEHVEIAKQAHEANPTNLWLSEEYIMLSMMNAYKKLPDAKKEDRKELEKAYKEALDIVRRIASTEQRDSGVLAIWGFILGEQMNYQEEQRRYDDALKLDSLYGEVYWYKAYSMSQELSEQLEGWPSYDELTQDQKEKVDHIKETYRKANDLRPMAAWIVYDYACELARWAADEGELSEAEDELLHAFSLNPATKERAPDEPYLTEILSRKRIKERIQSVE